MSNPYLEVTKQIKEDMFPFILGVMVLISIFSIWISAACGQTPLEVAQCEIGRGETIANNRGPDIKRYGADGQPWCAAFVSYCAKKAGMNIPYTLRVKDYLRLGKCVASPRAGDLIVFTRQGGGHIGIVEKVEGNKITTIEGNTGEFPSKVKRITYRNRPKNLLGYIRLAKK